MLLHNYFHAKHDGVGVGAIEVALQLKNLSALSLILGILKIFIRFFDVAEFIGSASLSVAWILSSH